MKYLYACIIFSTLLIHAPAAMAESQTRDSPSRVDFDDRLVKGQRQGVGTIYIFERQKIDLRSMVYKPHSFRERIIKSIF